MYSTAGGIDYGDFDNTQVTLPAGETVVEFNITIIDDNFIETSEIFSGMLSIVTGISRVVIDSNADTATVTILDEADSKFLQYEKMTITIMSYNYTRYFLYIIL